ncbi:FadR/GntR family transcriptional regulator [Rhodococcus sp. ENV425]|uniref:FadR/GntR family transcriptional regulator n=1 Tax=Rhodococcus sp. ENV425 TaxID=2042960 RepID=UPI000C9D1296|nr:GntR family transcriptional regulator [Rhodococcus sp. ENV425]PND50612.1 FadR family transcriptional regulator [Rhodococcus sp. ENV425]
MTRNTMGSPTGTAALRRAIAMTRNEKVSRTVARMVAKDIADRRLGPGSALESENDMAKRFGVGRASVREGLRLLEAQGLVTVRQGLGGGPIVSEPSGSEFGDTLSMYLQANGIQFREVAEAALEMEGLAAAMLADRIAAGEDVDLTPLAAHDLRPDMSNEEVTETATGFHSALRNLTGNYVLDLTGSALAHLYTDRMLGAHPEEWNEKERESFTEPHRQIHDAIAAGNAELARTLTRAHMREVIDRISRQNPRILDERVEWL